MLLTIGGGISTEDLGYLLHKNPARVHDFELSFGRAHVFYPRRPDGKGEAALLLDVDPVGLVRRDGRQGLDQYVNDRPYASSSFLSVAISNVFGTAMSGRSKERQELADEPLDLEARITAVPCRGGEPFLRKLFEPLGYRVDADHRPLDEQFPEWGESRYYNVRLQARVRLAHLLRHLYVLVPVLDADKHYWVGKDEIEVLLKKGEGWLAGHPEKEAIAARYLKFDRKLTREALARLMDEDVDDPDREESTRTNEELQLEAGLRLWEQRIGSVIAVLRAAGATSVVDLGCGEGKLLRGLLEDARFTRILGVEVSWRTLEAAQRKLRLDELPAARRERISLIHGSLLYRDRRISGFDAATLIEVIEHLDPPRLAALERVVFEHARPRTVLITTPNAEYNAHWPSLPAGQFRHQDHRFEWSRAEFAHWAQGVAARFEYSVRFVPVGPEDPTAGPPTQMAVFGP